MANEIDPDTREVQALCRELSELCDGHDADIVLTTYVSLIRLLVAQVETMAPEAGFGRGVAELLRQVASDIDPGH